MKTNNKQQGFTIIEVVLVLAIAGLIFLAVFLAVPALQRSQRDTARRNDVGRVVSQLQSYRTNAKGSIPTDWTNFRDTYLSNNEPFEDPSAGAYTFSTATSNDQSPIRPNILVHVGSVCSNTSTDAAPGGARNVAFRVSLETGGVYCVSN